jgi:uncharacterized protein
VTTDDAASWVPKVIVVSDAVLCHGAVSHDSSVNEPYHSAVVVLCKTRTGFEGAQMLQRADNLGQGRGKIATRILASIVGRARRLPIDEVTSISRMAKDSRDFQLFTAVRVPIRSARLQFSAASRDAQPLGSRNSAIIRLHRSKDLSLSFRRGNNRASWVVSRAGYGRVRSQSDVLPSPGALAPEDSRCLDRKGRMMSRFAVLMSAWLAGSLTIVGALPQARADKPAQCASPEDCSRKCDKKDLAACVRLGWMYEYGHDVDRDLGKSFGLYKQACDGKSMPGCVHLGVMYEYGKGVATDQARAAAEYKRACDGKDPYGCANLGLMYAAGKGGLAKDGARAAELFQTSCDGGDLWGCVHLGWAYDVGIGVAKDDAKAFRLYQEVCDKQLPYACARLGLMFEFGHGTKKDAKRAVTLYDGACKKKEPLGCHRLGLAYKNGVGGLKKDLPKAASLVDDACDHHEMDACNELGILYLEGKGVTKDLSRAFGLFQHACAHKNLYACGNVGICYVDGKGVEKNDQEGRKHLEMACNVKIENACKKLTKLTDSSKSGAKSEAKSEKPKSAKPPGSK